MSLGVRAQAVTMTPLSTSSSWCLVWTARSSSVASIAWAESLPQIKTAY